MNDFVCGACAGGIAGLSVALGINYLWYVKARDLRAKMEQDKALIADALEALKKYRAREQKARMMEELSKPMSGMASASTGSIKVGNGSQGLRNRRYVG